MHGCAIAGKENHGCEINPNWACRSCCADCPTKCERPKCIGRPLTSHCAWRTTTQNLVWISLGFMDAEDVWEDNLKKKALKEHRDFKKILKKMRE